MAKWHHANGVLCARQRDADKYVQSSSSSSSSAVVVALSLANEKRRFSQYPNNSRFACSIE